VTPRGGRAFKAIARLTFAVALSLAVNARAGPAQPPLPATGAYKIDPARTEILFGVRAFGFTTYYGAFSGASGALDFDRETPADSRLEIHVPTASLLAPSRVMTTVLKGPKWLNIAAYPEMVFRADQIRLTSATTATVSGALTLHGVTHPLVLEAHFDQRGRSASDHQPRFGFQARGSLRRSDYGLNGPAPLVSDDVQLILGAAFEHVTAAAQGAITP
jgi:polyisoprenoid-binding protein YceI